MKTHAFWSLSVLIVSVVLAASAAGQPGARGADAESRTVRSGGLDAAQMPDAEVLYRRIRKAAGSACRAQAAFWDVKRVLHQKRCVARAVEEAIAQADAPLLTAVHRAVGERVAER